MLAKSTSKNGRLDLLMFKHFSLVINKGTPSDVSYLSFTKKEGRKMLIINAQTKLTWFENYG